MDTSTTGIQKGAPALLTRMSSLDSLLTQALMDESERTSRVSVSMPREVRRDILAGLRAVA